MQKTSSPAGSRDSAPTDPDGDRPPVNPYDPAALRNQFLGSPVKPEMLTVPARRPGKTEFFRVRPDDDFILDAATLEYGEGTDRETYLITGPMQTALRNSGWLENTRVHTCLSRAGVTFLWPMKLPSEDHNAGRAWRESALEIAEHAKTAWVRMRGNRALGAYEMAKAEGDLGEPEWPDKSLAELLALAFKGRLIDRPDHPVLKALAGLI